MRQANSRTIGQYTYDVRQLPATPAYLMLLDLAKMVTPSAAAGVASIVGSGGIAKAVDAELDGGFLMAAVEGLVDRLDNDKVQSIIQQLAAHTAVVAGDKYVELSPQFEVHFAGRLGDMFRWLAFALEVNFSDFLPGLKARAKAALQVAMATKEQSRNTSSGQSGDSSLSK